MLARHTGPLTFRREHRARDRDRDREVDRQELAELRSFIWDRDIERDASSGRLDQFANEAIDEYRTGKTRPL